MDWITEGEIRMNRERRDRGEGERRNRELDDGETKSRLMRAKPVSNPKNKNGERENRKIEQEGRSREIEETRQVEDTKRSIYTSTIPASTHTDVRLSNSKHFFYLSFTSNLHACSRNSSTRILRRASTTPLPTLFVSSNAYSSASENAFKGIVTSLPKPSGGEYGKYFSLPALNDSRIGMDCFGRLIASAPDAWIDVVERYSNDYNKTYN
ncbi:hypothetical protein Sjap_007522 [Stephania japonica]|uniref:Uncharacterized protein n=1 Tax=Stephania japonica TaxID=461633 RepID=A0AAP0PA26_9MAGN